MRVLNDFTCAACGSTHEHFEDNSTAVVECQDCGKPASRRQRPIRSSLDPHDPGFPGAYHKWADQRKSRVKAEQKDSGYDHDYDANTWSSFGKSTDNS